MSDDLLHKQLQAIELAALLAEAGDDPILGPQLKERLEEANAAFKQARTEVGSIFPLEPQILPRFAIFLKTNGTGTAIGIRPSLAGNSLIQYERMFVEQALHDERQAARAEGRRRRPRGSPIPELLFTATPRGSFGLEFVPLPVADELRLASHARSMENVASAMIAIATADDDAFDKAVTPIPGGVLQPLKQFFKILASNDAEIRFAYDRGPSLSLQIGQIKRAAELLDRDVKQSEEEITGTFRGVTHDSGYFDLRTNDDSLITGTVAEGFTEDDLDQLDGLKNRSCVAILQKTTIQSIGGSRVSYVLLKAEASV